MKERFSAKRTKILNTLKKHNGALSAGELSSLLPEIDQATVYRNLEKFVTQEKVRKIQIGSNSALYEYGNDKHHHAVCGDCDEVIHFSVDPKKIEQIIDLKDFEVKDVEIIVRGNHKHQ